MYDMVTVKINRPLSKSNMQVGGEHRKLKILTVRKLAFNYVLCLFADTLCIYVDFLKTYQDFIGRSLRWIK